MPIPEKIEEIVESLKKYINTNIEIVQLSATERVTVMGSGLISNILIGVVILLFIFFISLGAALFLSVRLGDYFSGFAIVGGFYFLLSLILIIGRKKLLEKPLLDIFIRKAQNKD